MNGFVLDHIVIGVGDLDEATADYTALLGREPSWRGSHPSYGTRNTLYRIDNTYIELLGLGGDAKAKDGRWAGGLSRFLEQGEGVYALALGTADVDETIRELRNREVEMQDARDGSGIDELSGSVREWRNAMLPAKSTNGTRVFFIEHRSASETLPFAPAARDDGAFVNRLDHVVVLSPDMEASRRVWGDALGVRLALDRTFPERNTRILFFRLGDTTIEISGGAQQTEEGMNKPDRYWGLAWGVGDLRATVERLRAAGIEVSDARTGVKPGTLVATAKGPRTHGVATLLIEHRPDSFKPESREAHRGAYDNAPQKRAFYATGLDRVSLAVNDIDETARTWLSTLGLRAQVQMPASGGNLLLSKMDAGNAVIELVAPVSQEHRAAAWIAERGPGMYGVAITIDNLDSAIADLRAKGVVVSDAEYGEWPGTRVARITGAYTNGVALTLVQRLPDVL